MKRIATTLISLALLWGGIAQAATLKIATVAPEGSEWMTDLRASAKEIRDRTEGRVVFKYYGGGSQGTDEQVLRRMKINSLQGGVFTPSALMGQYPDIGLYGLPMLFASEEEAAFVRAEMDTKLKAGLEDAGFISFGFSATGFALLMSRDPVTSLADLRGKRVWVPEGDEISKVSMEAMDVSPLPLPLTDVYTSLQTGNLDIIAMSSVGAVVLQYHTRLNYVTDLPLVYTIGLMVVDKKAFSKISAADQAIVYEVMNGLYERYDTKNLADDRNAKQALFDAGLERIVPAASEVDQIRATLSASNRAMADGGVVSSALYEETLKLVEQYRAGE
ncbi:MAG: TRAP transporter substrate-binding protein DctP [Pseudomonadota bacterium]